MVHALRSLTLLLVLLAASAVAAENRPFAREDMASDAVRLTETLRLATAAIGDQVKGKTPRQLLAEAARAVAGGDFATAEKLAGAAITAAPKDPANWLATPGSPLRPTTPRRTIATKWSRGARRLLMPHISIRRRQTPRPTRLLSWPICSPATSNGAPRSTP